MSVIGVSPFIGVKMATFDILKHQYLPPRDDPKFLAVNLLIGAIAGSVALLLTYPADLVRRRIQLLAFGEAPYKGIADCVGLLYRTEGIRGFYTGMLPSLLKMAPAMAVVFAVNEQLKNWVGVSN